MLIWGNSLGKNAVHRYAILGAGGLAREIASYLDAHDIIFATEDTEDDVLRGDRLILIGIGDAKIRTKLRPALDALPDYRLPVMSALAGRIMQNIMVGRGTIICTGSIVTTGISIGEYTLVNIACTIGHDAKIGDCCVINPGATISGEVTIGDGCLIGANCTILQGLHIGDGATVGAGAVVTKDVEPGTTVIGVPARRME